MNVMRFVGRTSGEAMRKLRDALGPDALVLANRPCPEGVELLAAAPGALGAIDAAPAPRTPRPGRDAAPVARPAARAAAPREEAPAEAPSGMSTVSFQDYVRQRLRERNRQHAGGAPAAGAALAERARAAVAATHVPEAAHAFEAAPSVEAAPSFEAVPSFEAAQSFEAPRAPRTPQAPVPTGTQAAPRTRSAVSQAPAAGAFDVPASPSFPDGGAPQTGFLGGAQHLDPARFAAQRAAAQPVPEPVRRTVAPEPAAHDALVAELQSLKAMMSRQFATMSWFEGVRRSPVQGRVLRTLVAAGLSLKLARSVVAKLPSDFGERDAQTWVEDVLARNLRCATPAEAFEGGGVYALVGPTGVGKTTTTAKIAARHVLKHGAQSVALITVDTYRLGAHDQLRAFGRILGVPVHIAHDAAALHDLLRLRTNRQLVLVDTVGLGHRDERIRSLLTSLPRTDVGHVVVASCAAQAETIDESLRAYEARQAAGVILTKVDEAARLGGALDCLVRQRLRLLGVCDGQRVPEDWHAPDAARLVRRALLAQPAGAFALEDEELPLVFGVAATLQEGVAHA
jgi:flagellar biosynthesis protein FlhF